MSGDGGQTRFEHIFQVSPVAMSISRLDDRLVVQVNEAYLTTFGVTAEAISGAHAE